MTVYGLLDKESREWWYYRSLRERGGSVWARRLEREDILRKVLRLRGAKANGGFMLIGNSMWWLYISDNERLECRQLSAAMPAACRRVGIPVVDVCGLNVLDRWELPDFFIMKKQWEGQVSVKAFIEAAKRKGAIVT